VLDYSDVELFGDINATEYLSTPGLHF